MYFPLRSQRCVTFPGSHIVYATLAVSRWRQAFLRGACWDFFSSLLSSFVSCLLAAFSFLCLLLSFPLSFKRCDDAVFDHVVFFFGCVLLRYCAVDGCACRTERFVLNRKKCDVSKSVAALCLNIPRAVLLIPF